ncbi:hypothetical protein NX059_003495 [Plenodomus lindquistii]|nr:hypothetical protein NX059_003495 [Plenodomus lindquistii]
MQNRGAFRRATTVLLLATLASAIAHGDSDHGDTMDMSAPAAAPSQPEGDGKLRSYWSLSEHATLMYWHIALEIVAWVVVLPIAVMMSIARSGLLLPSQLAFLAVNALALVLGVVYNHQTPELYANNAHSKIGWSITWIASAWVFTSLVKQYTGRSEDASLQEEVRLMSATNMARYQRVQEERTPAPSRWSHDSGQGTERNSESLFGHSRSPSVESENLQFASPVRDDRSVVNFEDLGNESEKRGFLRSSLVDRFMSQSVARYFGRRTLKAIQIFCTVIERSILLQGFAAITSGTIVYGGIGRGDAVFNVLAHYVKGGIFFLYGLLTLGRWVGAFADFGWAWNVKPARDSFDGRRWTMPSAEFVESFVIWLYGATNVFLEHLAAWGDEWTAQDLEHVSISVMFFGGGLLGMIVESRKMRDMLNYTVTSSKDIYPSDDHWQQPRQYPFSMNPMPALIIMLLGKMMSSHHQSSMLSAMIHGQWGSMFMGFSLARCLTYITLYISPPTSFLPSRPPTEIITAFCLISGGITFMVSNKDTVAALEGYHLDAMFIFTITMGLTALLMAWTTVVIAIKGWAVRKENGSWYTKSRADAVA